MMDDKGRCCGKKPDKYKRYPHTGYFCSRCYRAYDLLTKQQKENGWWWKLCTGWERRPAPHYGEESK